MKQAPLRPLLALAALGLAMCTFDPVEDDASADLGDEAPGVHPGPLHRPGQPCLVCHDNFAVGGTVYGVRGDKTGIANATVTLTDVNNKTTQALTNAAGNFYLLTSQWAPTYPVKAQVSVGTLTATMSSIIGRDGSCASCHVDPPSRISTGAVYVAPAKELLP